MNRDQRKERAWKKKKKETKKEEGRKKGEKEKRKKISAHVGIEPRPEEGKGVEEEKERN